ncbi:phage tail tape measure protein [Polycladidibacter stylochi]|uniref:phage tail tape measure protein n=1 Tax=Polycladidibacter stylochi TaxID=1807766 RepID=UPI0008296910|nr:phage tail tape measure protein [Pseudovibrio stylochi]
MDDWQRQDQSSLLSKQQLNQLEEALHGLEGLADRFSHKLVGGLKAATIEGQSLSQIMRQIYLDMSQSALQHSLKPLQTALATGLQSIFANTGTAPLSFNNSGSRVPLPQMFASGGIINAPTHFNLPAGNSGVMGEAGPEAIIPLKRDKSGQLGVAGPAAMGGGNITINISTPDVGGFHASSTQIAAMVARAAGRGRRGL